MSFYQRRYYARRVVVMKENWNYYKRKVYTVLVFLTIVLGMHGLYSHYQPVIQRPWQLYSVLLYETMKMFLFSSPLPSESSPTITYEIAKWIAPLLTSALILTKITNTIFHAYNSLRNRWSKKHLIIFEKMEHTDVLIQNLMRGKESYHISLVSKLPFAEEWKTYYEKNRVAVHTADIESCTPKEFQELMNNLRIHSASALIFGSSSDLENYSLFLKLLREIEPKNEIACYIKCDSPSIAVYLDEVTSSEKKERPAVSGLDINLFSEGELSIRMLMNGISVRQGILEKNFRSLQELASEKDWTAQRIDETLGEISFLVLGVNELMMPFLTHLANDLTLSLSKKPKIHIVDFEAEYKMEHFLVSHEELQNALDIHVTSLHLQSRHFAAYLKDLKEKLPPTAIFFFSSDTVSNLEYLKVTERYFGDVPKVFRNASGVDLKALIPLERNRIQVFGDIHEIMTQEILIRSSLDQRAKAFNTSYNQTAESAGLYGGASWEALSQTKKNSSRASAAHALLKEEILRTLYPEKNDNELWAMLDGWFEEFRKIQPLHRDEPERFQTAFCEYLKAHPVLDFLSRLEHQRWCNSYYAMNFKYGPEKDEINRTHPCLIEDWNEIIGVRFFSCHPEYDLIATFALFPKEE